MKMAQKKQKEHPLITQIANDPKLSRDEKMEYKSIAQFYTDDFKENMNLSSLELADKYEDISYDDWAAFLAVPAVVKYTTKFVREKQEKQADIALATGEGTRDAVQAKKLLNEMGSGQDNSNFIIIRIPAKEEFDI